MCDMQDIDVIAPCALAGGACVAAALEGAALNSRWRPGTLERTLSKASTNGAVSTFMGS
jgi:hypothetical protein